MKKLFIICAVLIISSAAFSQPKKDTLKTVPPVLQAKTEVLTDSTALIPLLYLQQFDKYLQERFTVKEYNVIMEGLQPIVRQAIDDWNRKNPAPAKQK